MPLRIRLPLQRVRVHARRCYSGDTKANFTRNVIDTLEQRGFISAVTNPEISNHVDSKTCVYGGVDPSASSLHVGNLVALMGLLHFKMAGHDVLALIGGATGMIGDPSGRSSERSQLDKSVLEQNISSITRQVELFFERSEEYIKSRSKDMVVSKSGSVKVLNNHDWIKKFSFLDFLRDVGKLAKVNTMMARDSVKSRLNSKNGISFTEFSYQLLQAYDFVHLYRHHDCRIQLGGSDQWGNIVAGIDMLKRQNVSFAIKEEKETAFGVTFPLLTSESGEKFGKSAGNAIWLDEAQTNVHHFYQFFVRMPDSVVEHHLKMFTLLSLGEIGDIMARHNAAKMKRFAQKVLASEVTELVHGRHALEESLNSTGILFDNPAKSLSSSFVVKVLSNAPFFHRVSWDDLEGKTVRGLLVHYGIISSGQEAGRLIRNGGVLLSGETVSNAFECVKESDIIDNRLVVIKAGKKAHLVLYFEDAPTQPILEGSYAHKQLVYKQKLALKKESDRQATEAETDNRTTVLAGAMGESGAAKHAEAGKEPGAMEGPDTVTDSQAKESNEVDELESVKESDAAKVSDGVKKSEV